MQIVLELDVLFTDKKIKMLILGSDWRFNRSLTFSFYYGRYQFELLEEKNRINTNDNGTVLRKSFIEKNQVPIENTRRLLS